MDGNSIPQPIYCTCTCLGLPYPSLHDGGSALVLKNLDSVSSTEPKALTAEQFDEEARILPICGQTCTRGTRDPDIQIFLRTHEVVEEFCRQFFWLLGVRLLSGQI